MSDNTALIQDLFGSIAQEGWSTKFNEYEELMSCNGSYSDPLASFGDLGRGLNEGAR